MFLRGRLVPPDEIEDLVQDLFARLMKVKRLEEKMSASSGSNRSYLLTMANNLVVDMQRKASIRSNYAAGQRGLHRLYQPHTRPRSLRRRSRSQASAETSPGHRSPRLNAMASNGGSDTEALPASLRSRA